MNKEQIKMTRGQHDIPLWLRKSALQKQKRMYVKAVLLAPWEAKNQKLLYNITFGWFY